MSKPRPGKDYIIVALDVDSVDKALELVKDLRDHVGLFKVGLELIFVILGSILGAGNIYEAKNEVDKAWKLWWLLSRRVMLDVKLYDIPNTMQGAARAICSRLGVRMLTLHASSTQKGMAAAVAVRGTADVVAVTVLTSFDSDDCNTIYGREPGDAVRAFALMAREAGVQSLVCSPQELGALCDIQIKKITPGVRPSWAAVGDQKRVMAPGEAVKAGADYIVIGRPIANPPEGYTPVTAAQAIAAEIDAALAA